MKDLIELLEWKFPQIDEKAFVYSNALVIGLANQSETTLTLFRDTPAKEDFVQAFIKWKYNSPEKKTVERMMLFEHAIKKVVEDVNENFELLIKLLLDETVSISDVIESKHNKLIRSIYTYIERSFLSNEDVFFDMDLEESVQWIEDILSEKYCLVIVFELLYILNHNHVLGIDEERFNRMRPIMQMYVAMMVEYLECNELKNRVVDINELEIKMMHMEKTYDKTIKKKKRQATDYHEQVLELKRKIKAIDEDGYIKRIQELSSLKSENETEIKRLSEIVSAIEDNYVQNSYYEQLNNKFNKLHDRYSERGAEILKLKNSLSKVQVNLLDELAHHLKSKGLTHDVYQLVYPYLDKVKLVERPTYFIKNRHAKEMIGYVQIIDGEHYVTDFDEHTYLLNNIPQNIYLAENQFVIVDEDVNCIEALNSKFDYSMNVKQLGVVRDMNGYLRVQVDQNDFLDLDESQLTNLRENNVIDIKNGKVVKRFDFIGFRYENYKKSIASKGHAGYVLTKILNQGFLGKSLRNGKEEFVACDISEDLEQGVTIICDEASKTVIKYIKRVDFYQGMSGFDNYEFVTILREDDRIYALKENGEKRLFSTRNHLSFESGDVLKIDAFNNVLSVANNDFEQEGSDEAKIMRYNKANSSKTIDKEKNFVESKDVKVLIIGDYTLSEAYVQGFRNIGYESSVVSGHDPFYKIEKQSRKHDVILFLTKAASHSNYKTIKKAFKEKVLYINELGVNRVIEKFIERYENE